MSTRDGARLPSGLVGPSVCEMEKTGPGPHEKTVCSHVYIALLRCLQNVEFYFRASQSSDARRLLIASLVFLVAAIGAVTTLPEAWSGWDGTDVNTVNMINMGSDQKLLFVGNC